MLELSSLATNPLFFHNTQFLQVIASGVDYITSLEYSTALTLNRSIDHVHREKFLPDLVL